MPRRWGTTTHYWAYRFLVLRDGEICRICGQVPTTPNTLDIDHIDGDKKNNVESNFRLLCRKCNVSLENRRRAKNPSVQREGEREQPCTRVYKDAIPYHEGSAEMQANFLFEMDYRIWLLKVVRENGFLTKKQAINAGAEVCGCNPTTAAKYLAKLTSFVGPLMEERDMLGSMIVTFKPQQNGNGNGKRNGNGNGHKAETLGKEIRCQSVPESTVKQPSE